MPLTPRNPLRRSLFYSWLLSKAPNQTVGYVQELEYCPLAEYLKEKRKYKRVQVWPDGWTTITAGKVDHHLVTKNPEWSKIFVRLVDDLPLRPGQPVSAKVSIRLLESIKGSIVTIP